jgi:hypothetical protein
MDGWWAVNDCDLFAKSVSQDEHVNLVSVMAPSEVNMDMIDTSDEK